MELLAAGAGLGVFPCFAGDSEPRIVRVAKPITELLQEQWLVTQHEDQYRPEVRRTTDRITALMQANAGLFRAEA